MRRWGVTEGVVVLVWLGSAEGPRASGWRERQRRADLRGHDSRATRRTESLHLRYQRAQTKMCVTLVHCSSSQRYTSSTITPLPPTFAAGASPNRTPASGAQRRSDVKHVSRVSLGPMLSNAVVLTLLQLRLPRADSVREGEPTVARMDDGGIEVEKEESELECECC